MEELFFDSIRMKIPDAQFRMSTDSMVLADFCRIRPGSRVLDLGCGCGTLGLLLLGADETLRVCGIEIQGGCAAGAGKRGGKRSFRPLLRRLRRSAAGARGNRARRL
ncbi:MAG: methionine biosynthesis protein MetW [Acutalibacteraceae bacterium]